MNFISSLVTCHSSLLFRNLACRMEKREWKARTKHDLMIEVWEHLDCETVGATELETIESVVRERFGEGAVESPDSVERLPADQGEKPPQAAVSGMNAGY